MKIKSAENISINEIKLEDEKEIKTEPIKISQEKIAPAWVRFIYAYSLSLKVKVVAYSSCTVSPCALVI